MRDRIWPGLVKEDRRWETVGDRRHENEEVRQGTRDRKSETEDGRQDQETGSENRIRRLKTVDGRQDMGDRRGEKEDRR